MDIRGFYGGTEFHAYQWLGAHFTSRGAVFRLYAPNAEHVGLIGDHNNWSETPMMRIQDGRFYETTVSNAWEGMRYKFRVHERGGRWLDRADPFSFATQPRPETVSVLRRLGRYQFRDDDWLRTRAVPDGRPMNIYELHLGSWRNGPDGVPTYRSIAQPLIAYLRDMGYNYLELMPLCEYPCDASWGYQATGYYSPTARYGQSEDLKYLVDQCHQNGIGVLLDFALVHFAVDDFGLANFDGTPLFEYPYQDIAYNEWGSKNFDHGRGEVRSFLQSAAMYWLEEFHFDGLRMDAVRNVLYWQGNVERGVNRNGVEFLRGMNEGLKIRCPSAVLIAEDSSAYPDVTAPVWKGGLGFDYKWDLGWMNDTLDYFREDTSARRRDSRKLTFSMHYFYNERFLLPLSHDEVVHGKAAVLQKMNGPYEDKFPQARALYLYMYAHPGKKLNFMGGEIGQLREWDERREQDWNLLAYPIHDGFRAFMRELNHLYLTLPALYAWDHEYSGFEWLDLGEGDCVCSFLRRSAEQTVLTVFNFADRAREEYRVKLKGFAEAALLLDTDWPRFGGTGEDDAGTVVPVVDGALTLGLPRFSAKLFLLSPAVP